MPDSEKPNGGEIILYHTQVGKAGIGVFHQSEIFWLDQKRIAELFAVETPTIKCRPCRAYDRLRDRFPGADAAKATRLCPRGLEYLLEITQGFTP